MYERLTLVLEPAEMAALRQAARLELRKPRDQARHMLRVALLTDPPRNEVRECAKVVETTGGALPLVQSQPSA